jgi:hypothetical protein
MLKFTRVGSGALNEMHLIMGENGVNAVLESGANLIAGASAGGVVDRYRLPAGTNSPFPETFQQPDSQR